MALVPESVAHDPREKGQLSDPKRAVQANEGSRPIGGATTEGLFPAPERTFVRGFVRDQEVAHVIIVLLDPNPVLQALTLGPLGIVRGIQAVLREIGDLARRHSGAGERAVRRFAELARMGAAFRRRVQHETGPALAQQAPHGGIDRWIVRLERNELGAWVDEDVGRRGSGRAGLQEAEPGILQDVEDLRLIGQRRHHNRIVRHAIFPKPIPHRV